MRPDSRPEKPYTLPEALDRIGRHFVVEGNPKSMEPSIGCVYGGTGCAIGCLITKHDAYQWDNNCCGSINRVAALRELAFLSYFSLDYLDALAALQSVHDDSNNDNIKSRMESEINRIRKELVS